MLGAGASAPYGLPLLRALTWDLAQSLAGSKRKLFMNALRECNGLDQVLELLCASASEQFHPVRMRALILRNS
jgi:hypothetical protein